MTTEKQLNRSLTSKIARREKVRQQIRNLKFDVQDLTGQINGLKTTIRSNFGRVRRTTVKTTGAVACQGSTGFDSW